MSKVLLWARCIRIDGLFRERETLPQQLRLSHGSRVPSSAT